MANSYHYYSSKYPYGCYQNILHFRKNFIPGLPVNKDELEAATDVALELRVGQIGFSGEPDSEWSEVPLADDPNHPKKQDFVRLEQWFLTYINRVNALNQQRESEQAEADSEYCVRSADAIVMADEQAPQKPKQEKETPLEGEWSLPMSKIAMMTRLKIDSYQTFNAYANQYGIKKAGNRQTFIIRVDKMDKRTRALLEKK